ncbi:hypothetical protein SIN8267_01299 [Sinobacterium norvegicum]|uniref:HTH araC/xylS-type domain-containing protein n=1 Tax=Sinobacterium norvegicum TaxID=1641715 RepID=A0ABM9ADE1_9GAMM|nr:helix-turn-helix domain-containing protein [Sinobacterium norvegicum]CAH0991197.1 hypothetical protein SIN8267_01299 [Sinobacterium norvegicum]
MNITSTIAGFGGLLGLLLALALYAVNGRNRYANRILASFVAVSSLYLVALVPLHGNFSSPYWLVEIIELVAMTLFLSGPILYSYVRAMTTPGFRLGQRDIIHMLPFFLLVLSSLLHMATNHHPIDDATTISVNSNSIGYASLLGICHYLLLTLYMLLSLRCLRRYQRRLPNQFSSLQGVSLQWLYILVSLCLGLAVIGGSIAIARIATDFDFWPRAVYSISLMLTLYYTIAFKAITQPIIFNDMTFNNSLNNHCVADNTPPAQPQYLTSSLTQAQAVLYRQQLEQVMSKQQPYLNNELRLGDLSALTDIPANHLSQVLNQQYEQNFFEFINRHRIEQAKQLLTSPEHGELSMLEVAMQAGFNSQSAFYKQFKLHVAQTPAQYRRQNTSSKIHATN